MKLRPAVAFVLMVLMLAFALGFGAYRGWGRERARVEQGVAAELSAAIQTRAESAYNLMTVARRHLSREDEDLLTVQSCWEILSDPRGVYALPDKAAASGTLANAAGALLAHLEGLDSVRQDSRDLMYVQSLLPQMLQESGRMAAGTAYNEAAAHFNQTMTGSLSGCVARLLGVDTLPLFSVE